jgi:hypothetical protein
MLRLAFAGLDEIRKVGKAPSALAKQEAVRLAATRSPE